MLKMIVLSLTIVSVLSACSSRRFVHGEYDGNVNDTNLMDDKWSESDMQNVVRGLVASMKKHRSISAAKRPPILMVTRLKNNTSEHIETQSITDMIRVEVARGGDVVFVDKQARDDVAAEYEYQKDNMSKETKRSKGGQVSADYIVNGQLESNVQQTGNKKSVYYKITLNMTNLKTNLIEWSDYKQIRKRYNKQRIGL